MNRLFVLALVTGAPLFACAAPPATSTDTSSTSSAMTIHGTLPASTEPLDNARAIAVGANGHVYSAYLDPTGQFTLTLPVGHAYRVLFANSRLDGSEVVLGHVVVQTSSGASDLVGVRQAGQLELGTLSTTKSTAGSVRLACNCGGGGGGGGGDKGGGDDHGGDDHGGDNGGGYSTSGGSDHGDGNKGGGDYGCHENDGEPDSVCKDDDSKDDELYCENEPGDACDAHDLDDDDGKSKCKSKTNKSCGSSGSTSGSGGSGGSGTSSSSADDAGAPHNKYDAGYTASDDAGGSSSGGCQVNAQCGASQVCCGGACHAH